MDDISEATGQTIAIFSTNTDSRMHSLQSQTLKVAYFGERNVAWYLSHTVVRKVACLKALTIFHHSL